MFCFCRSKWHPQSANWPIGGDPPFPWRNDFRALFACLRKVSTTVFYCSASIQREGPGNAVSVAFLCKWVEHYLFYIEQWNEAFIILVLILIFF